MIELAVLIVIVGTSIAAYKDHKTGYMPDEVSYLMVLSGLILLPLNYSLPEATSFFMLGALVFGITLLAYFFGQLGGGDVKLFTGMTLLVPQFAPVLPNLFGVDFGMFTAPYPFIVSIFFLAALLATIFVSVDYLKKLFKDRKKITHFSKKANHALLYFAGMGVLGIGFNIINPNMLFIWLPLMLGASVLPFKNDILLHYVSMEKPVSKLNDDDVIALELLPAKVIKALGFGSRKTFLDLELVDIKKRAKKAGIKKIMVAEYMPRFGPFILISLIVNLFVGDFLFWILFA